MYYLISWLIYHPIFLYEIFYGNFKKDLQIK